MSKCNVIFSDEERAALSMIRLNKTDVEIAREMGIHRGTAGRLRRKVEAKLNEIRKLAGAYGRGQLIETVLAA